MFDVLMILFFVILLVASIHHRTGYVEMCCVCLCIDIGYGATGEIRECSKEVFIGQLFVETAFVAVKQNSDLLGHSQLDGSQGCVAMIC